MRPCVFLSESYFFPNLYQHNLYKHKSDYIFQDPKFVNDTEMTHPIKLTIFDTDLKNVAQTKQLLSIFTSVKKPFAIMKPSSKYALVMLSLLQSGIYTLIPANQTQRNHSER